MKYSTYNFKVKKALKVIMDSGGKYKDINHFINYITDNSKPDDDIELIIHSMRLWLYEKAILDGYGINIFIKGDIFFDFLSKTEIKTKMVFPEKLKDVFDNTCFNVINNFLGYDNATIYSKKTPDKIKYNIIIEKEYFGLLHHNSNDITQSIFFVILLSNEGFKIYFSKENLIYQTHYLSFDEDMTSLITYKNNEDSYNELNSMINVLINLLLYCNVFPNKILDGVPDDFDRCRFDKTNYRSSASIEIDESIFSRSGVTPHFRSGHFAKLESERYVNKRGQIIWVSESFVKGFTAKTVIE
jgi:hypothetical protein